MVEPDTADEQLRALLKMLKTRCRSSYEKLARQTSCSPQTVKNYITKPRHGRDQGMLEALLTALDSDDAERAEAVRLHRLSRPDIIDPEQAGSAAAAAAADCSVWEMAQFSSAEATVHTAIDRRVARLDQHHLVAPLPYVLRDHDTTLRRDISAAANGNLSALIVLRGASSTGKTRSLLEAIRALCPGWAVVRPRSAAALRGLAESGLLSRRPCVLWLNELQNFLGPKGTGLSVDVLRDLFANARTRAIGRNPQPVVAVATLWPEKLDVASGRQDAASDNRDLLTAANQWVRWHEVPPNLSPAERARARTVAADSGDSRLDAALADPDRVGFTQTLAGAYELLQHYTNAPHSLDRLLLDAAGDARRLGHINAMPALLLRDIALGLWREERGQTSPPPGWFDSALAYATRPLRSTQGVQALILLDNSDPRSTENDPAGYNLADYLEQHLARTRRTRPIADSTWIALRQHAATSNDLILLARAASDRGRFVHAESLYRGARGPEALYAFAEWLETERNRVHDAEQTYRAAAAAGNRHALVGIGNCLRKQPGREHEAEQAYRYADAAGSPHALLELVFWLQKKPEREHEAEQVFREAVAARKPFALSIFIEWLQAQLGREHEIEQAYREHGPGGEGDDGLLLIVVDWLAMQPGREQETEQLFRDGVAAGDLEAQVMFAEWLTKQSGREREAEQLYRGVAASDDPAGLRVFAGWLAKQPGREREAERTYRGAVTAGDPDALQEFVNWLATQPEREDKIEQLYRESVAAGNPNALRVFVNWLATQPGREDKIEQAYREHVAAGAPDALRAFADWLGTQSGRETEAEQTYRRSLAAGDIYVRGAFARWLKQQPGREHDLDHLVRFGLDTHDLSDTPSGLR